MLFDIDKLQWDPFLCEKFGIPMCMLPEVKPSSCIYGYCEKFPGIEDIAGIPIASSIGDQPGALFGQGCFEEGQAKNTYGTGCFLLMNTGEKRINSRSNLLTGIAWGLTARLLMTLRAPHSTQAPLSSGCAMIWSLLPTLPNAMNLQCRLKIQTGSISCPLSRVSALRIGICMPAAV